MDLDIESIGIDVDDQRICGTLLSPAPRLPGVLFVHGWGGSQDQDLARARETAGLGCTCMTFDLRGHEDTANQWETVSRAQNLDDLLAAYDWLLAQPSVDADAIAVIGVSYGGYLAAILSSLRPVQWLALRSPAIYRDEGWELSKQEAHDERLPAYRRSRIHWQDNRALRACAGFRGDVLIVEAEHDEIVPRCVIENYIAAFTNAHSLTSRRIAGADHGFSAKPPQRAYSAQLLSWLSEMIAGGRQDAARSSVDLHKREKRRVQGPTRHSRS